MNFTKASLADGDHGGTVSQKLVNFLLVFAILEDTSGGLVSRHHSDERLAHLRSRGMENISIGRHQPVSGSVPP